MADLYFGSFECVGVCVTHTHTHLQVTGWVLLATCGSGLGYDHTYRKLFGCQKRIKGPTRPKFERLLRFMLTLASNYGYMLLVIHVDIGLDSAAVPC